MSDGEVEVVQGNLADEGFLRSFLRTMEVVVHFAAIGVQSRDRDWLRAAEVNILGSLRLISAAAAEGVHQAIVAGTCLEYSGHGRLPDKPCDITNGAPLCREDSAAEPADAYGATKAAAGVLTRARAREAGLPLWYLRLASTFGPGDDAAKLLPAAALAARRNSKFIMTRGEQVRDWLFVDDTVAAFMAAIERAAPTSGRVLNIGTGNAVSVRAVVELVFRSAQAPTALVEAGAIPYRQNEAHCLVLDGRRASEALGWAPKVGLADGIYHLVEGCRP